MKYSLKSSVIILVIGVLFGLVFWGLGGARWPLMISFALAYLFFPLVQRLERRGIHRNVAVLTVFVVSTIVNLTVLALLIPGIISEVKEFLEELPRSTDLALTQLENLLQFFGLHSELNTESIKAYFIEHANELSTGAVKSFTSGFGVAFAGVSKWILSILNILLVPIFFFYFINDFENIINEIESYIPLAVRPTVHQYVEMTNKVLRGYIRGQCMVSLILMILYSAGLMIVGIKFGLIIGIITGLLSIIPYAGFTIGFCLALVMSLANFNGIGQVLGVFVVYGLVQIVESFVVTPKLVGNTVGLKPLVTMLALIIGGNLFGLVGMLIAIPIAALLKAVLEDLKSEFQNT